MNSKASNYMVIIIVLLLVVAIITGAGLCYLSWSEEPGSSVSDPNLGIQSSESISHENESYESTSSESESHESESQESESHESVNQESTETEATGPQGTESEAGLSANTVTMTDIQVDADGEYQYIKDGSVVSRKGIDVSKYQKKIDWAKVKADGVEYAFIRVGCRGYGSKGTLIWDETFHQNVKGALAQGIQVGAYFFSQAITVEEALEEAELVIKELKDYNITYPVAMDIERVQNDKARQDTLSKEARTEICIAFCERIKEAGYIPMVYGDLETFETLLDAEAISGYDFWVCETDGDMTFPYEFAIWQYAHTGKVDGISTDTNISIAIKEW